MIKNIIEMLKEYDPEVGAGIEAEYKRQKRGLELIASENLVSEPVMLAMGTHLTNKYAEGYPAHRYYGGCECVDVVENIAIERACKLFGAEHANVQPHSGAQANLAVYTALVNHGDTIMGMNLAHGGHLTHGSPVNFSGINYNFVSYGVEEDTSMIDYDKVDALSQWLTGSALIWAELVTGQLVSFESVAIRLYLSFLGAGVAIGGLGSVLFVGKYIKV